MIIKIGRFKSKFKRKERPKLGSTRDILKLLWMPRIIDNNIVWLEIVLTKQVYRDSYRYLSVSNIKWVDEKYTMI